MQISKIQYLNFKGNVEKQKKNKEITQYNSTIPSKSSLEALEQSGRAQVIKAPVNNPQHPKQP